jgi:hypothetical protein
MSGAYNPAGDQYAGYASTPAGGGGGDGGGGDVTEGEGSGGGCAGLLPRPCRPRAARAPELAGL